MPSNKLCAPTTARYDPDHVFKPALRGNTRPLLERQFSSRPPQVNAHSAGNTPHANPEYKGQGTVHASPGGRAGPPSRRARRTTDTRGPARGARSAATRRPALPLLTELLLCSKVGNRFTRGRSAARSGAAPGDAVPHQRHLPAARRRGRPGMPRAGTRLPVATATRGGKAPARPQRLPAQI